MAHYVYIMASRPGGAIYIGRTERLVERVEAHRRGVLTHTAKYKIRTLVWFEIHEGFEESLKRERTIKRWPRRYKNTLIGAHNPDWQDITHLIAR